MKKINENIQELRKICQFPRREYDTWHGKHVCRKFSIYITRIALSLGISANIVTLIFFMIGILACFFLMLGTILGFLMGALTLQFWYLIDHVDGEVARYRKQVTVTGVYFDKMAHYLVNATIFFSLGWGVYKNIEMLHSIAIGFVAGISTVLISASDELRDSSILQKAAVTKIDISFKKLQGEETSPVKKKSVIKLLFSFIHKLCTFPTVTNIITLVVIVEILAIENILYWLVFVYAVLATFVWMTQLAFTVKNKNVDRKWEGLTGNDT